MKKLLLLIFFVVGCNNNSTEPNVCDGAVYVEGYNCDGIPSEFEFVISPVSAQYYFVKLKINEAVVDSGYWIGAYNGDVCVGASQYNTSDCGNGVCEVMVFGIHEGEFCMGSYMLLEEDDCLSEGYTWGNPSDGYMEEGDIPSFEIFDSSNLKYYKAMPSENVEWENYNGVIIDALNVIEDCNGELGGDAVIDECGICDGDGIPEDELGCP